MELQVLFNGQVAFVFICVQYLWQNCNYFDHTFRYVQDLFIRLITQSGMWNFPWTNITFKSTKSSAIWRRIFVYETVLRSSEEDYLQ